MLFVVNISNMASSKASEHAELYKSRDTCNTAFRQSERRQNLLREQKQKRSMAVDDLRGIDEFVDELDGDAQNKRQKASSKAATSGNKIKLQESEWLMERPEDLSDWYLVPCPKGKRCMIVAKNGLTKVFNKYGGFMREFRSHLPGDHTQRHLISILDCVYISETKEYYVLDVIAYASRDMTQCEAACRFFWIQSKIVEDHLNVVSNTNEFAMQAMRIFDCSSEYEITSCLNAYPLWPENRPMLDGLLFYHKEASYVHGTTPLVGWALPFMLPEILDAMLINHIHCEYFKGRPADYVDYLSFIARFDETLAKKKKERRKYQNKRYRGKFNNNKMDVSVENECDEAEEAGTVEAIIRAERQNELFGHEMDAQQICDSDGDFADADTEVRKEIAF